MHEKDTTEVMNLVFQYLTPPDLAIAGRVSSTWDRIAKHENLERSTYFYIMNKIIGNSLLRWIFKNMSMETYFNFIPSLGIRFYNADIYGNVSRGSDCRNKQFHRFVINIKNNYNIESLRVVDILYWFLFPINNLTDVTILSFIDRSIANKHHCRSIHFDTDDSDKIDFFLHDIDIFFDQDNVLSSVLIIFCQTSSFKKLLRACQSLNKWMRDYEKIMWIAVVDELSFCRYNFGQHDCRIDTEFILMFINNSSMTSYMCQLSDQCLTAEDIRSELLLFKEENELSLRSVAFMHVPYIRILDGLYELDTSIFKEVFPDVELVTFYGTGSLSACYFDDLITQSKMPYADVINQYTSILLLSFI